jgi:hypothetical protein
MKKKKLMKIESEVISDQIKNRIQRIQDEFNFVKSAVKYPEILKKEVRSLEFFVKEFKIYINNYIKYQKSEVMKNVNKTI